MSNETLRKLLKRKQALLSMRRHLDEVHHKSPDNYGEDAYHWARELLYREMVALDNRCRIAEHESSSEDGV